MMGKVIVITGAGTGLGRALSRGFATDGEEVVILGRTFAKLEKVAQEIGSTCLPIACNIGEPDDVRRAFEEISKKHRRVDVLINNAAMIDYSTVAEASDAHILGVISTNLTGNLLCSRSAIHLMPRGGHIINVSSESVDAPYPHHVVYQATKGGIETMSRHLQDELRPNGISVSVVRAGPMIGEDQKMQASPEAAQGFRAACVERGIDLSKTALSHFRSAFEVFKHLVNMPQDMHIDTVRFVGRRL
jgi:meso-butanediol dehydrogenase/(S,S)-butanediol dehydrogenase/diacetyl reductase